MELDLLDVTDRNKAIEIAKKNGFNPDTSTWIRFWDNEKIFIDGDLTLKELKTLVEIMEILT